MAQSLYTRALDHFISFLAVKDRIIYYINNKSIYVSHLLETLAQSAGADVVKKAALLAEGNEWIDSSGRFL